MREFSSSSSKKSFKFSKKIIKIRKHQSNEKPGDNFHLLRRRKIVKSQPLASKSPSSKEKLVESQEKLHTLEDYKSIPLIPEVHLSAAEFADPINSIMKLREKYEGFGAVKICPPSTWKPDFCFGIEGKAITTRKQIIQELIHGKAFDQNLDCYQKGEFEKFANKFQSTYKYQRSTTFKDPLLANELEYWHMVDNPSSTRKTEVEYAADLSSLKFGSGFPDPDSSNGKKNNSNNHPFNLNNLFNAPDSLFQILKKKQDKISGISSPWVYMGMLWASFCWHIEDCYMYSANYMHKGAAKTWYLVPGSQKQKVEEVIKKTYPEIFAKRPNILNQIILQLNPLELMKEGISVFKTHQKPREFIITFPKAFHAGFSHGFNVSEAVNFVTFDWLQFLKESKIDYERNNFSKKLIFPLDWLVCENFWKIDESKMSQNLKNHLKKEFIEALQNESKLRKFFWAKMNSLKLTIHVELMKKQHYDKTVCFFCKNYSYLSYLKCNNCQRKTCLSHCEKSCCEFRKLTLFCKLSDQVSEYQIFQC